MANNPKRMQDPTEAALSAIQEALNVHDDDEQPKGRPDTMANLLDRHRDTAHALVREVFSIASARGITVEPFDVASTRSSGEIAIASTPYSCLNSSNKPESKGLTGYAPGFR